jgi:hypothetical protein
MKASMNLLYLGVILWLMAGWLGTPVSPPSAQAFAKKKT